MDDPAPAPPAPAPDQTAAWSPPAPATRSDPWHAPPPANGLPPAPAGAEPPPADWAAAIPTDVPAARRVADQSAVPRAWRPDESLEAEPAVPLGATAYAPASRSAPVPSDDEDVLRPEAPRGRRTRHPDDRPARAWPRIVAVISWIVLLMVVCWFYVFPWLERVLPENF